MIKETEHITTEEETIIEESKVRVASTLRRISLCIEFVYEGIKVMSYKNQYVFYKYRREYPMSIHFQEYRFNLIGDRWRNDSDADLRRRMRHEENERRRRENNNQVK